MGDGEKEDEDPGCCSMLPVVEGARGTNQKMEQKKNGNQIKINQEMNKLDQNKREKRKERKLESERRKQKVQRKQLNRTK